MKIIHSFLLVFILSLVSLSDVFSQEGDSQLGGWYAYLYTTTFGNGPWGVTGDFQHRNFEVANDFQQWIARAAISYDVKGTPLKLTAGYGYFKNGTYGESNQLSQEHRFHQDILLSQAVGRINLGHRFRIEERFVEDQDFRTRFRYMLAARVPITGKKLIKNTLYGVAWTEIFVNGQKNIGDGRSVNLYDRNWAYVGLGYAVNTDLRIEGGYMRETTNTVSKGQLHLAIFHNL